jgi:tRNA 2-selenouridine synthase
MKMIVLGGMTGSCKTRILQYLCSGGQQVLDLERLANHKGSAFGALGQPPQPTTEQFGNILYNEWKLLNRELPVWVEDESQNIGSVFIPERFYLNMQEAASVILVLNVSTRLPRLIEDYSNYPSQSLKSSVLKISKRLGGDKTKDVIDAIEKGDIAKAIEIVLYYYDKAYLFGLNRKNSTNLIYVDSDTDDIEENALKILEAASAIKW